MPDDSFTDLRNHIQALTDEAAARERALLGANAGLLNELNIVRNHLREGTEGLETQFAARELKIAERLAVLLGNENLKCFGVDDLLERLERVFKTS